MNEPAIRTARERESVPIERERIAEEREGISRDARMSVIGRGVRPGFDDVIIDGAPRAEALTRSGQP